MSDSSKSDACIGSAWFPMLTKSEPVMRHKDQFAQWATLESPKKYSSCIYGQTVLPTGLVTRKDKCLQLLQCLAAGMMCEWVCCAPHPAQLWSSVSCRFPFPTHSPLAKGDRPCYTCPGCFAKPMANSDGRDSASCTSTSTEKFITCNV